MRLRSFTAPDMPAAMKLVRQALGDDAVILTSEPVRGRKAIQVTAAVSHRDEPAVPVRERPDLSDMDGDYLRFEAGNILRFHNLPEFYVAKLLQKAQALKLGGKSIDQALLAIVSDNFTFDPLPIDVPGRRIMLIGPAGAGKTLAVARMATKLAMDKHPISVITTDNQRAGGVEQLEAFTRILHIDLKVAGSRTDLAQQLASMPANMRVLIDTAGCNPYQGEAIKELAYYSALGGVEPVLVLPAGGDSMDTIDMAEAFMALPCQRLLVTRTDTARRFGGVLATALSHGLNFCNASISPSVVDALQPMDAAFLATLLLRHQQTQELNSSSSQIRSHAYERA